MRNLSLQDTGAGDAGAAGDIMHQSRGEAAQNLILALKIMLPIGVCIALSLGATFIYTLY